MISAIIPTYKNKKLFFANLKHNLHYLKNCEVVIVNDDPEESLKNDLTGLPVVLIENKKNLGFSGAVHTGVLKAKNPYVFLLNSDTIINNDSFGKILDVFQKNNKLFAVCFAQREKDGSIAGKNTIFWKNGFVRHDRSNNMHDGITAWAEGGACIIDREKYISLGGFDTLYSPFYWEDIDLSYRAWKAGYQVYFDSKIVFKHYHESTIGKYFKTSSIKTIAYRNQFIFVWKNITDKDKLLNHILNLPIRLISASMRIDLSFIKGFLNAVLLIPHIITQKQKQNKLCILSDADVLNKFSKTESNRGDILDL